MLNKSRSSPIGTTPSIHYQHTHAPDDDAAAAPPPDPPGSSRPMPLAKASCSAARTFSRMALSCRRCCSCSWAGGCCACCCGDGDCAPPPFFFPPSFFTGGAGDLACCWRCCCHAKRAPVPVSVARARAPGLIWRCFGDGGSKQFQTSDVCTTIHNYVTYSAPPPAAPASPRHRHRRRHYPHARGEGAGGCGQQLGAGQHPGPHPPPRSWPPSSCRPRPCRRPLAAAARPRPATVARR